MRQRAVPFQLQGRTRPTDRHCGRKNIRPFARTEPPAPQCRWFLFVIEANGICIDEPSPPLRSKYYDFPHIDFSPPLRCIKNQMFAGNNVTPKEKSDRTRSPLKNLDMKFPCHKNTLRCQKSREATKHLLMLNDSGIMNFLIAIFSFLFKRGYEREK